VSATLPILSLERDVSTTPHIRPARPGDAERLAAILNQGIEDRVATFETTPQSAEALGTLISAPPPLIVAELEDEIVGLAKVAAYEERHAYYAGIGEATLYIARDARRRGIGKALLEALAAEAARAGYHKLVGKIFASNTASIALVRECGWREVGVHQRHGQLDGEWKDVLVVERLLGDLSD
jgi:L-amino acid N-acyltransferase YncA